MIDGQKVWTSWSEWSDWCFALCRTDPDAPKHKGLSFLLVPMRQPGVEIRPIPQITGTSEFSETFFDGARTAAENVVGEPGDGWKVANGTLAFERGASTLGQNILFQNELAQVIEIAKRNGRAEDPVMRQRLASAWIGLEIMRYNALRILSSSQGGELPPAAMITKIYWASWHRDLGKLAMDVLGRRVGDRRGLPVRTHRPAAAVPVHPFGHHLRGLQPDPAQSHRRARARPAARAAARGSPMNAAPPCPPGRGLLEGKTVLVTAAAGTGIGFAAAHRCARRRRAGHDQRPPSSAAWARRRSDWPRRLTASARRHTCAT